MDRTAQCSRCCLVFLLALLLIVGAVVAEDRTANNVAASGITGLRSFFDYLFARGHSGGQRTEKALRAGRTFGGHKRIQFMLMPMVYKMGVMMTMLAVLTVISLKGLMIGMILLVLKLSAIFGKLYASGGGGGHSAGGWVPPPQPVHVHLHNSGGGGGGGWSNNPPHVQPAYTGWEAAASGPPDEHYYYKG